jgi:hypothetical protein
MVRNYHGNLPSCEGISCLPDRVPVMTKREHSTTDLVKGDKKNACPSDTALQRLE